GPVVGDVGEVPDVVVVVATAPGRFGHGDFTGVEGVQDDGAVPVPRVLLAGLGHRVTALAMVPVTPAAVTRTVVVRPGLRRMMPAAMRRRLRLTCALVGALGFCWAMGGLISCGQVSGALLRSGVVEGRVARAPPGVPAPGELLSGPRSISLCTS